MSLPVPRDGNEKEFSNSYPIIDITYQFDSLSILIGLLLALL